MIIAGVVAFGVLLGVVYGYLEFRDFDGVKAVLLVLSNVYNMLVLVILLAYGLFNLPLFLWKYPDNKAQLYAELERAEQVRKDYRSAMADFYMIVSQCKNLIANHRTGFNTEFMDVLDSELPKKDLEGASIGHSKAITLDIKKGQEVNEDFISQVRYTFKVTFFLYKRKKSRWISLYDKIDSLIEKPVNFEDSYLRKNIDQCSLENMILKPKQNQTKRVIMYRIGSLFALLFCLFVLITEATVIINPEYTLVYFVSNNDKKLCLNSCLSML
jgi:hypothetical protein